MTSRVLGLVREQVVAFLFGAGHAVDAFNVAFRIPNLLRDLFAEGAMSAAFVPTFTRYVVLKGRDSAWRLASSVINALILSTLVVVAIGVVFAPALVRLFAEDYAKVPGKLELTISLTRIMFPFLTLVAVAAALMGMLNSLGRFFIPALSPAMFNIATIACALTLIPWMPRLGLSAIGAIAIGTLVGGLGQVSIQWPALKTEGYRYQPVLDLRDEGLRRIFVLMGPGLVGLAAVQINLFVNTVLATGQGEGAVSWLNYAFRLMYMPIGLFGVSVATAALPAVSRQAARRELDGMRQTLSSALRLMLMLTVPAAAGLIALAQPIVALLFEHGRFTSADTHATAGALVFYSLGLVGYSAVKLAVPTFYTLNDSRTPVLVSAATVLVNVVLNIALVGVMGYRGLALGTGVAALVNAGLLLFLLRRRLDGLDGRRVAVAFAKILVASTVMALAARWTMVWMIGVLPGGGVAYALTRVGVAMAAACLVLALAARALGIAEFRQAASMVLRRLGGATQTRSEA